MKWMTPPTAFLLFGLLSVSWAKGNEDNLIPVGDPPANHIWDHDSLFRNHPQALAEISKALTDLEEESDIEVYLVTYSAVIGEKPSPFSMRCHAKWMGEYNDGIVIVLSMNGGTAGVFGRSRKLYDGEFLESGIMPRVGYVNLEAIIRNSMGILKKEGDQVDRVQVFTLSVADQLKEHLAASMGDSSRENYHFMGWMALSLVGCGLVISLLSKLVGSVDRRSKNTYRFPEFVVPQRLKSANGGGKISVVNFYSPPSSGGR
jgi:hypothetical protein